jgi:ArsR family transcriptional regulator
MDKIFEALASTPRRRILAYLSKTSLTAGEIAERFEMSKPALSKHLKVLENAGLVASEKKGQYVVYSLVEASLVNTLHNFIATFCPEGGPLKKESAALARGGKAAVKKKN